MEESPIKESKKFKRLAVVSKYSFIGEVRRHMIDSWKNIDEILQKVCRTSYKSEKTRLLNMIGA